MTCYQKISLCKHVEISLATFFSGQTKLLIKHSPIEHLVDKLTLKCVLLNLK